MDNEETIKKMEGHISNIETELQAIKEYLASRPKYYENNKEPVIERVQKYDELVNNDNPILEQNNERIRQTYLRKVEKLKEQI